MKYSLLVVSVFLVLLFGMTAVVVAQSDVTAPGDPISLVNGVNDGDGNSGPPPDEEGVEHAIDDAGQKYLNFLDLGSGFTVTPTLGASLGGTVLTGARFYTANDADVRDPASYLLEGSNDGAVFAAISAGPLSLPAGRNPGGNSSIDLTRFHQEVSFINALPYLSYRVTFPTLKDTAAANSMQIAEVELLGVVVPEPATWLLTLIGVAALAFARRRR